MLIIYQLNYEIAKFNSINFQDIMIFSKYCVLNKAKRLTQFLIIWLTIRISFYSFGKRCIVETYVENSINGKRM